MVSSTWPISEREGSLRPRRNAPPRRIPVTRLPSCGPWALTILRWLIERGQLDPCVLGALVARGSRAGIGADFLTKTLGTDRFDAPRRATLLSACSCPTAMFHPVWVERMAVTLLTGRDPPGKGDPRRWYREAAANLLGTHPAGAIRFINRHQQLACRALFSHDDKGGQAAQAAVDDMLLNPPAGLEKEAEDALERVVTCAANNEFSAKGKRALACLLARPETLQSVTVQIIAGLDAEPARERGFNVSSDKLKTLLSDLMVDTESRRTLLDAANRMAAEKLGMALAAPDASARRAALDEAGAVFGALASRSYSLEAALDARGWPLTPLETWWGRWAGSCSMWPKPTPSCPWWSRAAPPSSLTSARRQQSSGSSRRNSMRNLTLPRDATA